MSEDLSELYDAIDKAYDMGLCEGYRRAAAYARKESAEASQLGQTLEVAVLNVLAKDLDRIAATTASRAARLMGKKKKAPKAASGEDENA